jgi:transposase
MRSSQANSVIRPSLTDWAELLTAAHFLAGPEDGDESSLLQSEVGFRQVGNLLQEQRAMTNLALFVGLDYSEDGVQVCLLDGQGNQIGNRWCANDWQQIVALAAQHGRVAEAAIESCTGAANLAEELASRAGWSIHLAHPGYVERIKQSPDKTDYQDARLLADLVRVGYLPRVWLAPAAVRDLRQLVRYRQQLVERRRATKLRVRAVLREHRCQPPAVNAWTKAWLRWVKEDAPVGKLSRWVLNKHLAELERLAQELHEAEELLTKATVDDPVVERLREQAGVGPVTAWVIRAEIGRFDRFRSGKQLARFCGLSPRNASSGNRQADAGLIKASSPLLRGVLIEAAHRLPRQNIRWAKFRARLKEAGKKGSVIAAAIGNRWVRWLYHQMKNIAA